MLVLALLLCGCQPEPVLRPQTRTPAPSPAVTLEPGPPPTAPPQPASTAAARPPASAAATATPLAAPEVIQRYQLPDGLQGESVEVTPGRVWVGVTTGQLLEYDASNGALLNKIALAAQSYDGMAPVKDLAFDGQHLWAMVIWQDSVFTQIAEILVLDPASGQIVRRYNVTDQDPEHFGLTPGRVWTQNLVFDAGTLDPSAVMMNTDATVFGSDGQGGIWAGGTSACDTCPSSLYRYPVDDIFNARPGPAAADLARHLVVARQRLWVATDGMTLDGYDLAQTAAVEDEPDTRLDLSALMELPPAALLFDGTALWLLSSVGSGGGMLYQYDPLNGHMLDAVPVGDGQGEIGQARVPVAAAFDGRDIWVLTALDLARVGLPWTR